MQLHAFLRSLSSPERSELAKEVNVSSGYLSFLGLNAGRLASIKLADAICWSKVNEKLLPSLQFKTDDYLDHRAMVNKQKGRSNEH